jgi:hypothetical protein
MANRRGVTLAGLMGMMAVLTAFSATAFPWVCRGADCNSHSCFAAGTDGPSASSDGLSDPLAASDQAIDREARILYARVRAKERAERERGAGPGRGALAVAPPGARLLRS